MPTLSGSFGVTGSINVTGSIDVTGSITLNGNQIISGSINTTGPITSNGSPVITNTFSGSYATTGSNVFTGNQTISGSVVVSGSLTVSGSSTFTNIGPAIFQGPITASGDLRFPNTGSGVIQPINLLYPSGTGSFGSSFDVISTNTTTYLEYGINVVATGSMGTSSYCCRLPQTPQKGKSVTVINNEGIDLFVFPSTASGDINGVIDGYFTIPSDGKSYTFDCYENPLPGGWSSFNIPNGNTIYNSGIVTWNSTTQNSRLAFINNTIKQSGSGYTTGTVLPWNSSAVTLGTAGVQGGFVNAYYLPANAWQKINSISIRTNLTGSVLLDMSLLATQWENYFLAGTSIPTLNPVNPIGTTTWNTTVQNWAIQNGFSVYFNGGINYFQGVGAFGLGEYTTTVVPGTFVPVGGNPKISATIGGPGTKRLNWNINYNSAGSGIGRLIGRTYIGTGINYNGQYADAYWNHTFSPVLIVQDNIDGIRFQMTLNITPN